MLDRELGPGGGGEYIPVPPDGGAIIPRRVAFIRVEGGGVPAAGRGAPLRTGGRSPSLSKMWVASSSSSPSTSAPGLAPTSAGDAGATGGSEVRPGGGGGSVAFSPAGGATGIAAGGVRPSNVREPSRGGGGGGALDCAPAPPFLVRPSKTSRSDPFSSVAMARVSCVGALTISPAPGRATSARVGRRRV